MQHQDREGLGRYTPVGFLHLCSIHHRPNGDSVAAKKFLEPATEAWLREMWGYCPEVSLGERARKLQEDRQSQKRAEEWAIVVHNESTDTHAP